MALYVFLSSDEKVPLMAKFNCPSIVLLQNVYKPWCPP